MERTGYIALKNGKTLKVKLGDPLVVARRGGQNFAKAQMDYWFHLLEFNMPRATYYNMTFGREKSDVVNDKEGMGTAWSFGRNMACLIKTLNA